MPWTLIAYNGDVSGGSATLSQLTPAADQHVTVVSNGIVVPTKVPNLIGVIPLCGTGLVSGSPLLAQLQSPSLRRVFYQDVAKAYNSYDRITGQEMEIRPGNPVPLDPMETLEFWLAESAVTSSYAACGVMLADKAVAPVTGQVRTVKFTTSGTPTVNEWSALTLTPGQTLPVGTYSIVGARCVSAGTSGLFRFIIPGYEWRPGGVMNKTLSDGGVSLFRDGGLGDWGDFDSTNLPQVEILEVTAVSDPVVYIDLLKTK